MSLFLVILKLKYSWKEIKKKLRVVYSNIHDFFEKLDRVILWRFKKLMLLKRSLLNQAELLSCNMYKAFNNKQIIEVTESGKKLLLKEQRFNMWLLIYSGNPQMLLETQETYLFLKN